MRVVAYTVIAAVAALAAAAVAMLAADRMAHAQMSLGLGLGLSERSKGAGGTTGGIPASGVSLDFVNGNYSNGSSASCNSASTCLTTTRASTGTAVNSSGTWTQFAANQPRVTNAGLTVEESRTNGIRNNTMQGAVAGTPGTLPTNWALSVLNSGITQMINSVSVVNGVNVISVTLTGTISGTGAQVIWQPLFEGSTIIAAANGQVWSGSAFLSASNLTNITQVNLDVQQFNSGGTYLADAAIAVSPTSSLQRFSGTGTLNQATVAFVDFNVYLLGTGGTTINTTLQIGWPQLEQGPFATTPIPTASTAVTRQADNITLTTLPTMGSGYTVLGSGAPGAPVSNATAQLVFELDDTTANNRTTAYRSGNATPFIAVGGTTIYSPTLATWPQNTLGKIAVAYRSGAQASAFNGVADNTGVSAAAMATPTRLAVGDALVNFFWNGTISQVALWPTTALTAVQLQQVTQ